MKQVTEATSDRGMTNSQYRLLCLMEDRTQRPIDLKEFAKILRCSVSQVNADLYELDRLGYIGLLNKR